LATGSDFTLDIFGNANMDDRIDDSDISYLQDIIKGSNERTKLADANNDSVIDEKDIEQTKLIISGEETELTFIDCDGITVTIKKPLKNIVAAGHSGVLEAVRVLKAGDQIVGMEDDYLNNYGDVFLADLSNTPSVGTWKEPDFEKIIELKTDLIISSNRGSVDFANKLKGTDIQVIHLRLSDTDSVLPQILILGYLLDKRDEAQAYREWHDNLDNYFKDRLSTVPKETWPKAFWIRPGKTTCSGNSSYQGALEKAGGINIAKDLPSNYPAIDQEWILKENPDVIFGISFDVGYKCDSNNLTALKTLYDEITGTPEYKNIKATKDGRIFVTSYTPVLSAGYFAGVAYIAKWLHPELFYDLDPQEIHQEYLNKFQGIDFNLNKHGAFVYPPLNES
jgi:iron complex transport system substrate-binding protein